MRALKAAVGAFVVIFLAAHEAGATTYVITSNNMASSVSGTCALMEAVAAINAGVAQNGCAAPTGSNVIQLSHAGPYATLPSPQPTQVLITRSVTIEGLGSGRTISAQNGLKVQALASFDVSVTLKNLTFAKHASQSTSPSVSAYSHTSRFATLVLERVKVSGALSSSTALVHLFSPAIPQDPTPVGTLVFESRDSIFTGNAGPGLYAEGGMTVTLLRTRVSNNQNGGIRLFHGANGKILQSSVEDNFVNGFGGGIYSFGTATSDPNGHQNLTLERSSVIGNSALGDGGGIYYQAQHGLKVDRSTVSWNVANKGGGIYSDDFQYGDSSYSTIAFNEAWSMGGGFYKTTRGSGSFRHYGTIIAANVANGSAFASDDGTDIFSEAPTCGIEYCLIGTLEGSPCEQDPAKASILPGAPYGLVDPKLDPDAQYLGGATRIHRLLPDSPALDYAAPMEGTQQTTLDNTEGRGLRAATDFNYTYDECLFGDLGMVMCEQDVGAYEAGAYSHLGEWLTTEKPSPIVYTDAASGRTYLELFITAMNGDIGWNYAEIFPNSEALPSSYTGAWNSGSFSPLVFANTSRAPSAAVFGGLAYLFVTKADNRLWYLVRNANYSLGSWVDLGNSTTIGSGPSAVNANNSRLFVFVRGTNNQLKYRIRSSGTWGSWLSALGTSAVSGDPASVYLSGTNRVYVFAEKSGKIAYKSCVASSCTTSGSWTAWTDIDATIVGSGPSAAVRGANSIEVCVRHSVNNAVSCNTFNGSSWSGWASRPLTTPLVTPPGVVSRRDGTGANDTVDMFLLRDGDLVIEHRQTPW